jgi:hypothetical protein
VKLAVLVLCFVACSSSTRGTEPEDPKGEVLMRNAVGVAVSTRPLGTHCQDCLDDEVVKFMPSSAEYKVDARANLDRAIAALDARDLRLAVGYLDFLFARFGDAQEVLADAVREVEKRNPLIDAFERDCKARCNRCSSKCRAIDDACLKFCTVALPGHTATASPP